MNANEIRDTFTFEFGEIRRFVYDILRGELCVDATDIYHAPSESWASVTFRFSGVDYFRSIGALRNEPVEGNGNDFHMYTYENALADLGGEVHIEDRGAVNGRKRVTTFPPLPEGQHEIVVDEREEHKAFILYFPPAAIEILALHCEADLTPTPKPDLSWLER